MQNEKIFILSNENFNANPSSDYRFPAKWKILRKKMSAENSTVLCIPYFETISLKLLSDLQ